MNLINLMKKAWATIVGLFRKPAAVEPTKAQAPTVVEPVEAQAVAPTKQRRRKVDASSMSTLLANLDEAFRVMRLPFDKLSWVPREKLVGLRKLGVHVVHRDHYAVTERPMDCVPAGRELPAMLCVSFGWSRKDRADSSYPAIMFAVKERHLPATVSKCAGQHYLFGAGMRFGATSTDDPNKAMFWLGGYVTVRPDGSLHLHREMQLHNHHIRGNRRGVSTSRFTTRGSNVAAMARIYECEPGGRDHGEQLCLAEFAMAMNWWLAREENWSVAVKKDGERVTFAVPKELTATFFKDRIRVTNDRGATRRIVHHVEAHDRVTKRGATHVKEHIRGLSEFQWNGYSCRVTAPKFNGVLATSFASAGTQQTGDVRPGWLDMSKVGAILADIEDGRKVA